MRGEWPRDTKANGMLRKMMLAGLMTATILGGIAPAHAQRGEDGGWRGRGGERSARPDGGRGGQGDGQAQRQRSEEHTSELQSLMRISYAVLCLKKKNRHR